MSIEAMKLALEALEKNYVLINGTERFLGLDQIKDTYYAGCFDVDGINKQTNEAITALRTAIEQAEKQEPVAQYSDIVSDGGMDPRNKFDAQSPRRWVGLSVYEARNFYESILSRAELINKIDEFLEEKNT